MNYKLLLAIVLFTLQFSYAQTTKINATVLCNDFAVKGIEVVNLISKSTTITNSDGAFSIEAKQGDKIMFISKIYQYKTITLKASDFQNPNFTIILVKKAEELNEVVITNQVTAPKVTDMQELLDTQYADDAYSTKKNPFNNDGSILYGPDFFKIVKWMSKLMGNKKGKKSKEVQIDFKNLTENSISKTFFNNYLKLKTEEIGLFLEFCEKDAKSKTLLENSTELDLMDFLYKKSLEFKKL